MQSYASIVEVLQLVGAEAAFIARANDAQFLKVGIIAGSLGVGCGLTSLSALGFLSPQGQSGLASVGYTFLFGQAYIWETIGAMLLIPIVATLLALWMARFTLLRALANPK